MNDKPKQAVLPTKPLRINEFVLGINDSEKQYKCNLTCLGGLFRIVVQNKKTFKWGMALVLNQIDSLLFERMVKSLPTMDSDASTSYRVTKYEQGAEQLLGILRVGRSKKGVPYLRIEGTDTAGNALTATFPFLQMPGFRPVDENERLDMNMLTVDACINWLERDLPLGRALHNRAAEDNGDWKNKPRDNSPKNNPADDTEDIPF